MLASSWVTHYFYCFFLGKTGGRRESVYNYSVIKDVLYITSQHIKVKCISCVKAYITELCIEHGCYNVRRQIVVIFCVVFQQAVTFHSVPLKADNGSWNNLLPILNQIRIALFCDSMETRKNIEGASSSWAMLF